MRVVMLTGSFGDGRCGVGDYTERLARRLAGRVELSVIAAEGHVGASDTDQMPVDCSAQPALEVSGKVDFSMPEPESTDLAGVLSWFEQHGKLLPANGASETQTSEYRLVNTPDFSLSRFGRLRREVLGEDPDLVHIQYPSRGYENRLAVNFLPLVLGSDLPLVVTLHESGSAHPLRRISEVFLVKSADRLIVPGAEEERAVRSFYGRREGVEVLPVGCENCAGHDAGSARDHPTGKLDALPEGDVRIPNSVFHYGFPTEQKGLTTLVEAVAELAAGRDVQLYLALGGRSDHPAAQRALGRATELEISERIHLLGRLSEAGLRRAAGRMEAAVFPFADGFTTRRSSLMGLLNCGVPLVTTHGERNFPLVSADPDDPSSLARRLESVLELHRDSAEGRLERLRELQSGLCRFYGYGRLAHAHTSVYNALL